MTKLYLLFLLVGLVANSCAIKRNPSGGPKDEQPPIPLEFNPAFASTFFSGNTIKITFNEYVQLQSVASELLISPPLNTPPKVSTRGKTVIVQFQEELRPDITYHMHFGRSVVDFHEKNPAANLQYVFSTGSYVDSMQFTGKLILPKGFLEPVNVQLYASEPDSASYGSPTYMVRSAKDGSFEFTHLKAGTYWMIALNDQDADRIPDLAGEEVGFLSEPLQLSDSMGPVEMALFRDYSTRPLVEDVIRTGRNRLKIVKRSVFESEYELQAGFLDGLLAYQLEDQRDTTTVVWDKAAEEALLGNILVSDIESGESDTARMRNYDGDYRLTIESFAGDVDRSRSKGKGQLYINWTDVLKTADKSRIRAMDLDDSTFFSIDAVIMDSVSWRDLMIVEFDWPAGREYELCFDPGAVQNLLGEQNDSLCIRLRTVNTDDFGQLKVTFDSSLLQTKAVVEMLNQSEKVVYQWQMSKMTAATQTLPSLIAGNYRFRWLDDRNGNGKQDPGNFVKRIQPEQFRMFQQSVQLKGNWKAEVTLITN